MNHLLRINGVVGVLLTTPRIPVGVLESDTRLPGIAAGTGAIHFGDSMVDLPVPIFGKGSPSAITLILKPPRHGGFYSSPQTVSQTILGEIHIYIYKPTVLQRTYPSHRDSPPPPRSTFSFWWGGTRSTQPDAISVKRRLQG